MNNINFEKTFQQANKLFQASAYEEAIELFKELLDIENNNTKILLKLGSSFFRINKYIEAADIYKKVIFVEPNNSVAYAKLGHTYRELGDYKKAVYYINTALSINPNSEEIYRYLGEVNLYMNEMHEAIKNSNKSIQINPNYAYAYHLKGRAFYDLGNLPEALKNCQKAIELDASYYPGYDLIAAIHFRLKNYKIALQYYNKVIEINPYFYTSYHGIGLIYEKFGKYIKALEYFNMGLLKYPNYRYVYLSIARVNEKLGNNYDAYMNYNTYIYLSIKKSKIPHLSSIISYYQPYPQMLKMILDNFINSNQVTIIDKLNIEIKKIADFSLLINYYDLTLNNKNTFKAIISYYLGNSVESYMLFNKIVEKNEIILNMQDLYYYAISSISLVNNKIDWIIDRIENIDLNNIDDKSAYYIAQIYLLNDELEIAISWFEKSNNTYSLIMLAFLTNNNDYLKEINSLNYTFKHGSKLTYDKNARLNQFQEYFYLQECQNAIENINLQSDILYINIDYRPIWEQYKFDNERKKELENVVNKIELELIKQKIKESLTKYLNDKIVEIEDKKLFINDLYNKLLNEQDYDISQIFVWLNDRVKENDDLENQIGLVIEKWKIDEPRLYIYFIQYYFLKGALNSEEVFTLFFYLRNTFYNKNKKKDNLEVLFSNVIMDAGQTLATNIGINIFIGLVKNIKPIIGSIGKDYNNYKLKDKSDFHKFKEDLWHFIEKDRELLNENEFYSKYKYFNWIKN